MVCPKINHVFWSAKTHTGRYRKNNEDTICVAKHYFESEKLNSIFKINDSNGDSKISFPSCIFTVCDGMGGGPKGALASNIAVKEYNTHLKDFIKHKILAPKGKEILRKIDSACLHSHNKIVKLMSKEEKYLGMGTTLSSGWVHDNKLFFGHVGDSRIYLYRNKNLKQLTNDHSRVGKMYKNGIINERQARNHPHRSILSQVIGGKANITLEPHTGCIDLLSNDIILICSDGLYDSLWHKNITEIINKIALSYTNNENYKNVSSLSYDISTYLIEACLKSSARDNISILTIILD